MDYGYPTLAMFSETGELTRFPNPTSSGLILVSTGATTAPNWRDLALTDIKSGFPNAGVMISSGANQQPTSKAGSADKQFLKYSVSNNVGSYGFSAIGISDITGLQTALDGLVHSHPYLPLAGGVMNDGSAVSLDITEQHGNYYGLAYGSVTVSTSISEGSTEGRLLIETPIPANASSGIDFLPPSDGGEQYYQIHITGLDTTNKGKTIDIKIGLGLKASPQGNLNASNSGWSSYGTIMPSSITHGVKGNRHAFVIVLPKGSYKLNIDGLFDFGVSRGANFLTEFQSKCIALRGDGGWCLIPDSTSGVTLDNSAMTQYALPMYSHAHEALSAGAGLKYATNGQTYTGEEARTLSVNTSADFSWSGVHTFTADPKINKTGVLIGRGSSSQITAVSASTHNFFLKYAIEDGYTGYKFAAIKAADISDLSSALPTAYDSAAEPLGEVASSGLSNAYSRGDHIHPIPYVVPTADKLFMPRKIGIIGAITAEAVDFDGTGDVFLNALRIDPYFFETAVPVSSGGTGATTLTSHGLLIGNGTSAVGTISPVNSSAKFLRSNGLDSHPSYESVTWDNVTSKPSTFTPSTHTHGLGDIKGSGTASAVIVTNPTNTAGEAIGTTAGEAGQVLTQVSTGTNATVGWTTPRLRDVRAFYDIHSSSPSSVTHTKGHDTLAYVVDGSNLSSGATSFTCELSIPVASNAAEGDQIELHLISQAPAGVTGKLKVQINSSTSYGNLLFMKNGVIVQASSTNILECGNGQYIVLRAVAMSQSDRTYQTYNWLAKVVAEVN